MQTLFCFLLLAITGFGVGGLCLWRLRFARRAETFVFSSALGLAILGYLTFFLGAVGWMSPAAVLCLFGACGIAAFAVFARFITRLPWRSIRMDPLAGLFLMVLVAAAALNLLCTLNPILEVDSWQYHLPVAKAWLNEGRVFAVPYCLQSNYHFLAEMLNVVAFALSHNDVVLCKLVQWYWGILLALGTWCFARSFFSARVAWVAATLTYLVKEISWISAGAYIDLTVGVFVWLGFFAMVRGAHLRNSGWHALAGLFFGLAFAAKQSAAIFAAMTYGAYGVTLLLDSRRRAQLRHWAGAAVLAGSIAFAVAGPWMVKNFIYTNDPFFPVWVARFDVPVEYALPAAGFKNYYGGLPSILTWNRETADRLVHIFNNFRNNVMYTGANVLVVWLLLSGLMIYMFKCRVPFALRLLIATGLVAAPWFALVESRFLFGFFPAYLLMLIQTLRLCTGRRRWAFTLAAVVLLFFYSRTFLRYNIEGRGAKSLRATAGPVFSRKARRAWLEKQAFGYDLAQRLNRTLDRRDRLLTCGSFRAMAWINAPFLPNPPIPYLRRPATHNNIPMLLWERFGDREAMRSWLEAERVTHILLPDDAARALQDESGFVETYLKRLYGESSFSLYRLRPPTARAKP